MTTFVIEASSLCRVFASEDGREPVRAVDGVTFAVPPEARLVALIGPDGAGKSTLMQMICGLVGQDSGSLSVLGRTPDPDDEDFVNAVGYMPQTLGLYKDLSVMENMKLFGALRGTKPPEDMTIEAYYASLIALTGLEGFEGRSAGKLSGGMKQKLALAVALVRAPALLLLDEPTVGVDPLSRRELWAVIRRMVGQGVTTCFFSTAYLEEAESADWVLCMSEGRIIGSGTPAELLGRTKGRTYALDLSGFSDAERKSLSRRMMLKVSPAPEKSVFLDAVPRDGGIDLLLTHSPAAGLNDSTDRAHKGFACFNDLMDEYEPQWFVHGHVHLNYDAKLPRVCTRGKTTVINATERYVFEIPDPDPVIQHYPFWKRWFDVK